MCGSCMNYTLPAKGRIIHFLTEPQEKNPLCGCLSSYKLLWVWVFFTVPLCDKSMHVVCWYLVFK